MEESEHTLARHIEEYLTTDWPAFREELGLPEPDADTPKVFGYPVIIDDSKWFDPEVCRRLMDEQIEEIISI